MLGLPRAVVLMTRIVTITVMLAQTSRSVLALEDLSLSTSDKFEWFISQVANAIMNGQTPIDMSFNISNTFYDLEFKGGCTSTVEGVNHETEPLDIDGEVVDFCVAASLYSDSDHAILIHFLKIIFRVNIDKTTGVNTTSIDTTQTTSINSGNTCIDHDEPISAFQCDENYIKSSPPHALSQGNILRVCMKVNNNDSIFEFDHINELNITQAGNLASPVNVIAKRTEFAFGPSMTDTVCDDEVNPICKMKFQLLGSFFVQENPPPIHVAGNAKLALKSVHSHLGTPTGLLTSFIEIYFCINDDKTTAFSTSIDTVRATAIHDSGDQIIRYEELISAYHCDDSFNKIDNPPILNKGDVVQICIHGEDDDSIFEVHYIKELSITQAGNMNSPVNVITNRTKFAFEPLTVVRCNDDEVNQVCMMRFQLIQSFFTQANSASIQLSGDVKIALKKAHST